MTQFRSSILAIAFVVGMSSAAGAADRHDREDPSVRHCTNDPKLANDLYEYLQNCPAAQGLLNQSGQWVAVEHGSMATPSTAGQGSHMTTPGTAGQGGTMGTPSAPGGSSMSTAGQGGKAH